MYQAMCDGTSIVEMSASTSTSFQKKTRSPVSQIAGCKRSLHNNQLLVSSGIPSLDNVIGGGLAVGTVLMVEEDVFGSYARTILKYFLAEGVMNMHEFFMASADEVPEQILQELPRPLVDDPGTEPLESAGGIDKMKIAWRYQHMPKVQSSPHGARFGHYYDLSATMNSEQVRAANHTLFTAVESETKCHCDKTVMNPTYDRLLSSIKKHIDDNQLATSATPQHRNVFRIGIHSLGSPQWGEEGGLHPHRSGYDPSLCQFLYALRALMRSSYSVCMMTVPSHLFQDAAFTARLRHLCDTVVHLESFAGSDKEKNAVFKEYHGLFHIKKLPRLNSLMCHMPDTLDLAFKLKRKKFMIETLHLPPDLSETVGKADPLAVRPGVASCATSMGTSKLDF